MQNLLRIVPVNPASHTHAFCRQSVGKFSIRGKVIGIIACTLVMLISSVAAAQIKHDPDNENIEAAARRVVTWLESNPSFNRNEAMLGALVVNEVSKRYDRVVVADHPVVVAGLEQVLANVPSDSATNQSGSTYFPALAIILLCDIDDRKYANEIRTLIGVLENIQLGHGGFNYRGQRENIGDVSQAQYVGLAYFVAKHHGFEINLDSAAGLLDWLISSQNESTWYYHSIGGQLPSRSKEPEQTLSRHCAGLGTTFLLGDLLQLVPRTKAMNSRSGQNQGLPPSVSVYVKPIDDLTEEAGDGPLIQFPTGPMAACKARGNRWLANNFTVNAAHWNYYYLYALERYAFFRELADGKVKEIPDWYDQGVDMLLASQSGNGSFPEGEEAALNRYVSTCLATLFLVRSSEVLILPSQSGGLTGQKGFIVNERMVLKNGKLTAVGNIEGIDDVFKLLDSANGDEERELIVDSMRDSIRKFSSEARSRNEKDAFLTGLIKDRNYWRRLIAVELLAGEQNMDNVVPLLYALGDPDVKICRAAHDGLRLISRKIDTIQLSPNASLEDYAFAKRKWTEWFLQIRPDAKLID